MIQEGTKYIRQTLSFDLYVSWNTARVPKAIVTSVFKLLYV